MRCLVIDSSGAGGWSRVGEARPSARRGIKGLLNFALEARGQSMSTNARIAINKMIYVANQVIRPVPRAGLVHVPWHWMRYPFSLRERVLWSSALKGWFFPEDESAIECMLHMPAYEPVAWVDARKGEYCLDVGGYVGWYSIQTSRAVGKSGCVIVLEPDPINRRQLERNLALNHLENVQTLPLAAWSRSGEVRWHRGEEPVWHQITDKGEMTQQAVSIDKLVCDLKLPRLDWIKLDIEGAEVDALLGAIKTLRDHSPKLFIEVHETAAEVGRILFDAGYRITREHYDQPPDYHGWILAQKP